MKKTLSTISIIAILIIPSLSFSQITGVMTDQSGITYKTVKIGNKIWMAENLRTTKYANGEDIIFDGIIHSFYNKPVYVSLKNGQFLYSQYAVMDSRGIAPKGWHLPTNADWEDLVSNCNEGSVETDLKSTSGWEIYEIPGYYKRVKCGNCRDWNSEYRRKVACHVCKDTREVRGSYVPKEIVNQNGNNRLKFNVLNLGYYNDQKFQDESVSFWSSSIEYLKTGYGRDETTYKRQYRFFPTGYYNLHYEFGEKFILPVRLVKD